MLTRVNHPSIALLHVNVRGRSDSGGGSAKNVRGDPSKTLRVYIHSGWRDRCQEVGRAVSSGTSGHEC